MYIDKIILNNFRAYRGEVVLDFGVNKEQNVSIISGNNGYGKTSLLTSLLWCLYGKLIIDVDEPYRKEVYNAGGYKNYCKKLMNHFAADENTARIEELKQKFLFSNKHEEKDVLQQIEDLSSFSVTIRLSKIFIPAFPCDFLEVKRVYNIENDKESLYIYIDGRDNELTKQVGPEIFINDFILRKEIAKFFFFDAEKIVALAEVHTLEERRRLSQAYTEVLGIKKYLDLKDNLENLRTRLRKKIADVNSEKWTTLLASQESKQKITLHNENMIKEKEEELIIKQIASDKLQEQLIREGSNISVEELREFRQIRDHWMEQGNQLKSELKELVDLAPFAIAGDLMKKVKHQFEDEQEQAELKKESSFFKKKLSLINKSLIESQAKLRLTDDKRQIVLDIIEEKLLPKETSLIKSLLSFSTDQENEFLAIYENLQTSYSAAIKKIFKELKVQQSSYATLNRRIADAESKAQDPVIKTIRNDKEKLDKEIELLRASIIELKAINLNLQTELGKINAQISEMRKKLDVVNIDKTKDEVAARLIQKLTAFIYKLRIKKKQSLEEKILRELNVLMHKSSFVQRVEVRIEGELIDIELYDLENRLVDKNNLSKGEQQLYASALLKALVEESHIRFPVFIDSPLQKFDKNHAKNIILDFYPNLSGQVILFPLLEKELTEEEYTLLLPRIADSYLIEHKGLYQSNFKLVEPKNLFATYRNEVAYV